MEKRYWTEEEVVILRDHYGPGKRQWLSKTLLPRWSPKDLSAKARRLGLTRSHAWSPEEEEALFALAQTMPLKEIGKWWRRAGRKRGFQYRTDNSIRLRLNKRNESTTFDGVGGYKAKGLARCLGISPRNIYRWIKEGKLKAGWVDKERGDYYISPNILARFLFNYPGEFRYLGMDNDAWIWLIQAIEGDVSVKRKTIDV